ncbi:interleukin-17 receptor E isoform X1 [Phycodurus eques]|uniref:interleukin-17 receptor E isoform X1 n=1 Tax=Phycodurus eques TaxID=693459 RepID=UPI002ACD7A7A|nr:interleukin-17 receptor E isoform X1 [Phycodurus eques]
MESRSCAWQRPNVGSLAAAVVAVLLLPTWLLSHGSTASFSCQRADENGYATAGCPVKIGCHQSNGKCVTVTVWIKDEDLSQAPTIEIASLRKEIVRPVIKYKRTKNKWHTKKNRGEIRVWCHESSQLHRPHSNNTLTSWELICDCAEAEVQLPVTVSYSAASIRCSVNYTIPDPVPKFSFSVNRASKSITITVESEDKVSARWCYKQSAHYCVQGSPHSNITTIDPAQSRSALLSIPYLLPCVCIQVYYTHTDTLRKTVCPFQTIPLQDVEDVWLSSEVTLYESSLIWSAECPARGLLIFASLCWRHHEHLCTPLLNSSLEGQEEGSTLIYNTSVVDKHPQMCVKFSLQGSHNISCPFQADMSSWHVYLEALPRILSVYLNSSVPATFSAQLCVLTDSECASRGPIFSVTAEAASASKIDVPLASITERPCVQVWQSYPALNGRRILCPRYARNRWSVQVVAALILLTMFAFLAIFVHSLTKKGATDCLYIQKPVLLVCSSEQSPHISAACALASLLRGDLSATVHVALCAPSSQKQAGVGTGVADLGPLPWLYGQWEAVRKAQGKVLIVWSPEAKSTYGKWRQRTRRGKDEAEDEFKRNAGRWGKLKKDVEDKKQVIQSKPSAVIEPVFVAALACLEGALLEHKGGGVAFVYFQGLCHSRDIPKAFRDVPRYCIPQDFSGLIRELGGLRRTKKTFWWHCWPRLISKAVSMWLVRQLARRLQTLLPPVQRTKAQR